MKGKLTALFALIALLVVCILTFSGCSTGSTQSKQAVRIAMPYNEKIQNAETNYYKCWLEKQTGLEIKFDFIPQDYTQEYLRLLFSSKNSAIDAVFFNSSSGFPSPKLILEYGKSGYILPLEDYIDSDSNNLRDIFDQFETYDLRKVMTARDDHIYYMPGLDLSSVNRNAQTLWLNSSWLQRLKLSMPQTTEDLVHVLQEFKDKDPNGNGVADEIPLVGSSEEESEQVCNFLINSFVYNDPLNSHMAVRDGKVYFTPATKEWRQAMLYCRQLFEKGLLTSQCFTFNKAQLIRLANDPRDLVGGFTSSSITDVLLQSSPEILSQFVHIAPIKGPDGLSFSTVGTSLPRPGGVITVACKNPKAVFQLMDLMVGEEASLIGRYGEQGVDWDFAGTGDISLNGTPATVVVKNHVWNKLQNKYLLEMGPFVTRSKYVDGVTWRGFQADQEYINARAASSYRPYEPKEYIKTISFDGEKAVGLEQIRGDIDAYTNTMMTDFITGSVDIRDDVVWERYLQKYQALQIDELVEAVQKSYASSTKR